MDRLVGWSVGLLVGGSVDRLLARLVGLFVSSITGVHINQDLIWCVKMGVCMGFWVHGGS